MSTKLLKWIVAIACFTLSFDFPKNQQPQMLGSPYYAELVNKHMVAENAKIGFLPTQLCSFDQEFIRANSNVSSLLQKMDSVYTASNYLKIEGIGSNKNMELPEIYFGPMNDAMDVPMYVTKSLEGYAKNQIVMTPYKGKKKINTAIVEQMKAKNLDYILVPCLRETFIYPSGILKSTGIFSSTNSSAKNYYIDLGTNHVIKGEKMQSLNDPIGVFVLSVGLMNKDGKMVAMVTEGICKSEQSNLFEQILDIRTQSGPSELSKVINLKRNDLPTNPFAWQEAQQQAVLHLLQKNTFVPSVKYIMNTTN